MASSDPNGGLAATLRTALLVLHVGGAAGTLAELLLLEHWEEFWQLAPLLLLGLDLLVVAWLVFDRSAFALRTFQGLMAVCGASGLAGLWFHYSGNVEFKLELSPGLSGFALFKEALMGATPALAPGTMVYLAAIGLVYTFRHPALVAGSSPHSTS